MAQPPHGRDWWRYVPASERRERLRTSQRLRLQAWLRRRPVQISGLIGFYLLLCLVPLLAGLGMISLVALLPLAMLPPLGYLMYWLAWKEFNE